MTKSQNKKIKPPVFKEMMRKNILINQNMAKDFKDSEKDSKNMYNSKKSKLLNQKKTFNKMKKKVKSFHKNNKIRSTVNIKMLITIIIK